MNATAAAAMAQAAVFRWTRFGRRCDIPSVKRRLEVKAQVNGITIIDDFAHHPTAIARDAYGAAVAVIRGRACGRFSSRARTRCGGNVLQDDLANSLALADEVIVAKIFKSDAIPEVGAARPDEGDGAGSSERGQRARILSDADAIVDIIAPELRSGDVVAILSNGGFGGIYEKLPSR